MPMLCVAGTFVVTGAEPDGDSIRFVPNDPSEWANVPGRHRVRVNAHGGAQLRLDAIDALETHYTPRGGHVLHQPLGLAHDAAAELLKWLGFRDVVRHDETVTSVREDAQKGYLFTRTADTYGRCVALIGRGDPPGSGQLNVTVTMLRKTANHRLISAGLAYPTFYSLLYAELRAEFAKQAAAARKAGKGVFAVDRTQNGAEIKTLSTITTDAVIMPKLFRRLADYLHLNGDDPSLGGFAAFLEQKDDRLYVIPEAKKPGLDNIAQVNGQIVKLAYPREQLIFEEQ